MPDGDSVSDSVGGEFKNVGKSIVSQITGSDPGSSQGASADPSDQLVALESLSWAK